MADPIPPSLVALGQPQTAHIVYVHGFRGDHTTFQAFPSDLHNHLLPDIPGLQTWVYPTYKSAKPMSFAVRNFLGWLKTLPDGPVILAGHSMGGLLVAEAATDPSPVARRIIGVLAFDTPYLGMHPHVVVSGIASLFPKKDDPNGAGKDSEMKDSNNPGPPAPSAEGMLSEQTVNDEGVVNFVTSADAYPRTGTERSEGKSVISTTSPSRHQHDGRLSPPPPSRSPAPSSQSHPNSVASGSGSSFLSNVTSFFSKHADDPFIRFLNKHSDAPIAAMSRWVVEYFEFGWAMFDYPELLDRYERLEKWEGDWVCFWTVTGGEELEEDKVMGEGETPPPPMKVRRLASPGEILENEFEMAMKAAKAREEKRRSKEVEKKAKREEKDRAERERAKRKEEEAQEKQRKKEEDAQETERKKAAEALEKEMRKAAAATEKELRAKEEFERKEKARIMKEEGKRTKEAAQATKKGQTDDADSESHSRGSETSKKEPEILSTESMGDSTTTKHDQAPPEVVIEGADSSSNLNVDDTHNGTDNRSVTGSFQTAPETHNPDSATPSPAHSLTLSHSRSPSNSRPPSPGSSSAHHFITLPGKLHPRRKNHWLKVRITGVQDEVAAHCGLFIRAQNLDYDRFVDRVGAVVKGWLL